MVTLSIVNAFPYIRKRDGEGDNETGFKPCPLAPINVTICPDPPVAGQNSSFDIWGSLARTIPDGSKIGVIFANVTDPPVILGQPFSTSFCDKVKCPVQPYTEFNTTVQVPTPNELPDKYAILVAILNQTANQTQVLGCAVDLVGIYQDSLSYSKISTSSLWG